MKILVLNGPNMNMLGIREKEIYGEKNYNLLVKTIEDYAIRKGIEVDCRQSNHEGDLVDWIQSAYFQQYYGIVMNPAAYTHTSIAIADAIKAIAPLPVVEVHISDIAERDEFRHRSFCKPYCIAQIKGKGWDGYLEAIDLLMKEGI